MCEVSTANGEPYSLISSLRIVPEPKHETYSAVVRQAGVGPTQCVAYHIGGRPGQ